MTEPSPQSPRSAPVVILDAVLAASRRLRRRAWVTVAAVVLATVVGLAAFLSEPDASAPPTGLGSPPAGAASSPSDEEIPTEETPTPEPTPEPTGARGPGPAGPAERPMGTGGSTGAPGGGYRPATYPTGPRPGGGAGTPPHSGPANPSPTTPKPTPNPTPKPTPKPTPTKPARPPHPTPTPTPTSAPPGRPERLVAAYAAASLGLGRRGYRVTVIIRNPGRVDVRGWVLRLTVPDARRPIVKLSGATVTRHTLIPVFTPTEATKTVRAGRSVRVTFEVHGTTLRLSAPTVCTIDGRPCAGRG